MHIFMNYLQVIDPPMRTERFDAAEGKARLVRMVLHIVSSLSKQPPLAVKKLLESLQEKMIRHVPDSGKDGKVSNVFLFH